MAAAEKQVESMVYRLKQKRGSWPFLTPRLEHVTDKTRESASPLEKQIWEFLEEHLEVAEERERERERERDGSGEIRHGFKRSYYWRLLERAREGRTENQEGLQDVEIFESMLGEEVSERGVLRG